MGEVVSHHPTVHPILQPMFETLHTERLVLRPYRLDDAEARWQAIEESRDHLREASNERSAAVATRLGFRLEGHLRNIARQVDGTLTDELIYALIPTDEGRR